MCGIFGIVPGANGHLSDSRSFRNLTTELYRLSETRGKESAGVAVLDAERISVYKRPVPASRMVRDEGFRRLLSGARARRAEALIGHSRLVTNGSEERHENNQPVIAGEIVGVHNGIVVNDKALWEDHPELERHSEVDTEVVLALVRKFFAETGSLVGAARRAFASIYGNASVALLFPDLDALLLATNNGSLYSYAEGPGLPFVFASERNILTTLAEKKAWRDTFGERAVERMQPGTGRIVRLGTLEAERFSLEGTAGPPVNGLARPVRRAVEDVTPPEKRRQAGPRPAPAVLDAAFRAEEQVLFRGSPELGALRRCTRCVLPETFPFIAFDAAGVCSYCHAYEPAALRPRAELEAILEAHRSNGTEQDCLKMFSGGRDSSYAVHYVVKELGLNPVTYTYDWGMVTDLARRNISRVCSRLGLENVLVSADIRKKRANIRTNVLAWLRKPDLGMVPLFTAGDKPYFFFANRLKEQLGIRLTILSANPYEKTHFKHGFCGVPPVTGHRPGLGHQARIAGYYAARLLENPAYFNRSVLDNLAGFASFYQIEHDYLRLFNYAPWREDEVDALLRDAYDWETAPDTETTWRIGDGTAPFYNYIYYTVAGFTENDTFRSNQVREGHITRARALELVDRDNQPRHASLKWYLDTIGLGDCFVEVVETINAMPRLYADWVPDLVTA